MNTNIQFYGVNIKHCPLCNGLAVLERKSKTYIQGELQQVAYCRCTKCDCRGPRKLLPAGSEDLKRIARIEAVECWNRRVHNED